jgi:hypothetical protein
MTKCCRIFPASFEDEDASEGVLCSLDVGFRLPSGSDWEEYFPELREDVLSRGKIIPGSSGVRLLSGDVGMKRELWLLLRDLSIFQLRAFRNE